MISLGASTERHTSGQGTRPKSKRRRSLDTSAKALGELLTGSKPNDSRYIKSSSSVQDMAAVAKLDLMVEKLCNIDGTQLWQPRRLILTTERLFILLDRGLNSRFEVADSIPLEQVRGIMNMDPKVLRLASATAVSSFAKMPSAANQMRKSASIVRTSATEGTKLAESNGKQPHQTDEGAGSVHLHDGARPHQPRISTASSNPPLSIESSIEGLERGTSRGSQDLLELRMSLDEASSMADAGAAEEVPSLPAFEIHTAADGYNQGRPFYFNATSFEAREEWISQVTELSLAARRTFRRKNRAEMFQKGVRKFYDAGAFQAAMGAAICANFILTIAEMQLSSPDTIQVFEYIDYAFTALFAAELCVNFTAYAFWPFVRDGWNWFDAAVVLTSVVILLANAGNNSLVKQLRVIRTFRVLRAFRRFGDFRQIINSISASILPGAQALIIGVIVVAVFSTSGVQFFGGRDRDSFGDFVHAFYTLFGVVSYAPWPEETLPPFYADGNPDCGVLAYLFTFVVIVMFVLLQIVVAVIVDNFFKASAKEREATAKALAAAEESKQALSKPFEALLEDIVDAFDTAEDLEDRLTDLFDQFDVDASGKLSHEEMSDGIYKFDPKSPVRFNLEDFHRITESGRLCSADGELDVASFRVVMMKEIKKFIQRQVADALFCMDPPPDMAALLAATKLRLVESTVAQEANARAAARLEEIRARAEEAERERERRHAELLASVDAAHDAAAAEVNARADAVDAALREILDSN